MTEMNGKTFEDAGISEVLKDVRLTLREETTESPASDSKPKESSDSPHETSSRKYDSSEFEIQSELSSKSRSENTEREHRRSTQNPEENFTGEVNLADPESVIHMLETVDLTEEDTETLLQEALNMNRKLKEMLRRQKDDSKPKLKQKSKTMLNLDSHISSGASSSSNSRMSSSVGVRTVLPPISTGDRETSVYAIKLRRSKTNVLETKPVSSDSLIVRSKSTKPSVRKDSESPTRRRRASGPRPEWNDRFNYS